MSDTTAQEAKIPYPTEVGLMSGFVDRVKKQLKKAGPAFSKVKTKVKEVVKKVKGLVRSYHLFSKGKEAKQKTSKKIYHTVEAVQKELDQMFKEFQSRSSKSSAELQRLWEVMGILLPQIKHFIETGFVANKKIIHLKMAELYSIVRGKAGKKTKFGIKWGISRMGDGFVSGFVMDSFKHGSDIKFCYQAVLEHIKTFGETPETYGFDRGGYSRGNIKKMQKLGVKHIGIAPKGRADWELSKAKQKVVKPARAQVEGIIGTIKSNKYKFNMPSSVGSEL